ncbi:hypothetical protein VPHD479_0126 [Vibrio phage D479]
MFDYVLDLIENSNLDIDAVRDNTVGKFGEEAVNSDFDQILDEIVGY